LGAFFAVWEFAAQIPKPQKTGLSAPIFFAASGKKGFPLQSLARRQIARRRLCLRRVRSKRPRLRVCHQAQRYAQCMSLSLLVAAPRGFSSLGKGTVYLFYFFDLAVKILIISREQLVGTAAGW
jgi:hypothetical protein